MEIEELRAEVRRGEQRLRTANRDMKSMQVHGGQSCCIPAMSACTGHPAPQPTALQRARAGLAAPSLLSHCRGC